MILHRGETLFLQEEQGDLFKLKKGLLKVTRIREDGTVFLFNLLVQEDIFPHHSLLSPTRNYASVSAVITSEVERFSAKSWYEKLEKDPQKYKEVAELLQDTIRKMQERIEMTTVVSRERIPLFRKWLATYCPDQSIEELLTQEEIGQFLGLSRETVNRYLKRGI